MILGRQIKRDYPLNDINPLASAPSTPSPTSRQQRADFYASAPSNTRLPVGWAHTAQRSVHEDAQPPCIKARIDEQAVEPEDRTSIGAKSNLCGRQIEPYGCKLLKDDRKPLQHRAAAPDSHTPLTSGTPPTLLPRRRDVELSLPRIRSASWIS